MASPKKTSLFRAPENEKVLYPRRIIYTRGKEKKRNKQVILHQKASL
jgi:hypothetical protein